MKNAFRRHGTGLPQRQPRCKRYLKDLHDRITDAVEALDTANSGGIPGNGRRAGAARAAY